METFLLVAMILSDWLVSAICLERQYQFVKENKTWTDAQIYCRKHYTDLATIGSSEELNRFRSMSGGYASDVWIGLYSKINWKWSDGVKDNLLKYSNWESSDDDPDFIGASQFCVLIGDNGKWWDYNCEEKFPFICYNATPAGNQFYVVTEEMSWSNAFEYCQKNFRGLAKIGTQIENQQVQMLVPTGYWAWIGLFRDEDLYWSDNSNFGFSNWDRVSNIISSLHLICGTTSPNRLEKWKFSSCQKAMPFVCFKSRVKKTVVRLRLKSNRPFNLNDPGLKTELLRKIQENLKERAKVTFVEQPDGKPFRKEKEKTEL